MATGEEQSDTKAASGEEYLKEKESLGPDAATHPSEYGPGNAYNQPPPLYPQVPQTSPPVQSLPGYQIPRPPHNVTVVLGRLPAHKSLFEAYILCMPFGILGLHNFYLKRYGFGFLYFFTFGLCGVGWLVDMVRMPCLVKEANRKIDNPNEFEPVTLTDAYILWFPLGILGELQKQ